VSVWSKIKSALGSSDKDEGQGATVTARFAWSRDMLLRVAAPQGAGWELAQAPGAGELLCAFRCSRGEGADALVLHAKLFTNSAGKTAEALAEEDWKALWLASTFAEIDDASAEIVEHHVEGFREKACEVRVAGRGQAPMGALAVRERHLPLGGRLLVLTAAGSPQQHEAHARAIETWMTNSTPAK
jgi:hypothetical protein